MTNKIIDEVMEAFYTIMYPYPSIYEKNGYCLPFQNEFLIEEARKKRRIQDFYKAMIPIV